MPNIKSAKKRLRQNETCRLENLQVRTRMRTMRRQFIESFGPENEASSEEAFKKYCSSLDKSAKKGIIAKNTAIRSKRRAAAMLLKGTVEA